MTTNTSQQHEISSECQECFGKGWNDKWEAIQGHYLRGETARSECCTCDGTGHDPEAQNE